MDNLTSKLGRNRVSQVILPNEFEQSTEYCYDINHSKYYDDLFKKKQKPINLLPPSSQDNHENCVFNEFDSFVFLMCYIKYPTISLHSKDTLSRVLKEFRAELTEDDDSFRIKKLTKINKAKLVNIISSKDPIVKADHLVVSYFAHYLKMNIVVVYKSDIVKCIVCDDKGYDTIVVFDRSENGRFKLMTHDGQHIFTWKTAKEYLFDGKIYDRTIIDSLTMQELGNLASKLGVDLYKNDEGNRRTKLLKAELKMQIVEKI